MYGDDKMIIILMSFSTLITITLIICGILGVGAIFTKTSKKEYREWWVLERPGLPLPDKYKYDPNDPDDDKPKFGYWARAIISVAIFVTLVFVLIAVSVLLKEKEVITDKGYTTIMLGAILVSFISFVFFIANGIFRNGSRLQRMMVNCFLSIVSILTVVSVLLAEREIMTDRTSTFIRLGFILLGIIGLAFRIINGVSRNKTKKGPLQKIIMEVVGFIALLMALIYFGII
jgi:hypothetical protein